ncbi:hypothetical protein [Robbsia betulipollinis]|uniref:hypothetical protein n=1 Tax=Robbsia betulipollinis TaxID=2981849 RepID=UPI0032C4222F
MRLIPACFATLARRPARWPKRADGLPERSAAPSPTPPSPTPPAQGIALFALLAATLALPGCAWTLISAADAVGSVTQAGFSVASSYSSPTYVTGRPIQANRVCIELNNTVAVEDLVPAMRVALGRLGVDSTVYNVGTAPPDCPARLSYQATLDWGHRSFSDEYTRYLSAIDLRLVHGNDLVVAHYQTEGLAVDRFAATSNKLTSLIRKMVVGPSAQLASVPPLAPEPSTSGYVIPATGPAFVTPVDDMPTHVTSTSLPGALPPPPDLSGTGTYGGGANAPASGPLNPGTRPRANASYGSANTAAGSP